VRRSVLGLVFLLMAQCALAGTNGTLEGMVRDRRTGEPLPGVNLMVVGTQRGAATDTAGLFLVSNLRAGRYDVRFTHVGYQSCLIKEVTIHPDLRTRLRVDLEPTDVALDEMVVVQEKPLIQRDVTGTMHTLTAEETELLPLDNAVEALRVKPGVTMEGNVRGGKSTEVIYLVDGLPVQDVLSGGLSARLPNSSITGISIATGGFEAEYGNALSGVVNIVTRTGSEDHRFSVRADADHLSGGTQTSRTTEFEISGSGPLVGSRLFYLASLNAIYSGTRWWQDLEQVFHGPTERTVNGFAKLDYVVTPTLRLSTQFLYSGRDWRDYEFSWRFNLGGLPAQHRASYRIAAMLTHAVSESFYYTASLSHYIQHSAIGDGERVAVAGASPYEYDFFLRYIVGGERAWWSRTGQRTYTGRFDAGVKLNRNHLFRFGVEVNQYDLTADIVRLEPRKTYFGKPIAGAPQLDFSSAYGYRPRTGSAHVQSKIDLPDEGVLFNIGLRYDVLDPTAERPEIQAIAQADTGYTFALHGARAASVKQQVSPRFGAAMQIAERGYLFVNLGWYFQYPLFEYLYTGLDRVALARGISAITGNPDLEPERTKVWELALRYAIPLDLVVSAAYFQKESTNLVDTKTFIPGDSKLAGGFGFAEYVNNPYGLVRGLELTIARDRGAWVTGELSYTYMVTEAVSGSADDGFFIAQYGLPPGQRSYPLSWDQTHTVKGVVYARTPWEMRVTTVFEWHSGRPYTAYPTSTGFEKITGGMFVVNNARMDPFANVDIKAEQSWHPAWWDGSVWTVYLDCRNLLNHTNVRWVDSNGRVGGELGDPSGYFIGRRTSLGMKVDF
jgi:outer membrane receptor for ferrienterochelin and colicin